LRRLVWKATEEVILKAGSGAVILQHVENSAERAFVLTNIEGKSGCQAGLQRGVFRAVPYTDGMCVDGKRPHAEAECGGGVERKPNNRRTSERSGTASVSCFTKLLPASGSMRARLCAIFAADPPGLISVWVNWKISVDYFKYIIKVSI